MCMYYMAYSIKIPWIHIFSPFLEKLPCLHILQFEQFLFHNFYSSKLQIREHVVVLLRVAHTMAQMHDVAIYNKIDDKYFNRIILHPIVYVSKMSITDVIYTSYF